MGEDFDYAEEFKKLDLEALKKDIDELMTTSQDWWPADYGHYGPLFIRMAWHSAGTYRIADGRGGASAGTQRFAPLNSWPDNANLDKARRLLWPIKQKYGRKISWADLMVLAGNCALESMGFKTFGFAGGREDVWEPEEDIYWGPETEWLGDERYSGDRELDEPARRRADGPDLRQPGGAERQAGSARRGPGHPRDVRAHGDERRGDRRARSPADTRSASATAPPIRASTSVPSPRVPPSRSRASAGRTASAAARAATRSPAASKAPGPPTPVKWDNNYFDNLFGYEWELTKSPAGAHQWTPKDAAAQGTVPDAHDPSKKHAPMMLTTDLALRVDPIYEPISKRFHENPDEFADAFAKAWYKLTHRDMGPRLAATSARRSREPQLWQDPVPAVDHELIGRAGHRRAQGQDPRLGTVRLAAGLDRLGVGGDVPRHRQARRGERRAHSPRAAEGLGGQPAGRAGEGARDAGADPDGLQRRAVRRQEGLARRPDRAGRVRGRRSRPRRRPGTTCRFPSRRGARTRRRSRPTSSPSPCSSRPRTGSATTSATGTTGRRKSCWSIGRTC